MAVTFAVVVVVVAEALMVMVWKKSLASRHIQIYSQPQLLMQ